MILRSEEVRSVIHQAVDMMFDSHQIKLEGTELPGKSMRWTVKFHWGRVWIPFAEFVNPEDNNNSS